MSSNTFIRHNMFRPEGPSSGDYSFIKSIRKLNCLTNMDVLLSLSCIVNILVSPELSCDV
jgi:hypothetical protein